MKKQKNCKWLFIEQMPLLFEAYRVAKQLKIEFWLNSTQILKQLKLRKIEAKRERNKPNVSYIS